MTHSLEPKGFAVTFRAADKRQIFTAIPAIESRHSTWIENLRTLRASPGFREYKLAVIGGGGVDKSAFTLGVGLF